MSEVTNRDEEATTEFAAVDWPPRRRSRLRWLLDTRWGRLAVAGVALVLVVAGLAWWSAMGADRVGGKALPSANVAVDTGSDATTSVASAVPLTVPGNVTAKVTGTAIAVAWQASPATDQVAQYVVYRDGVKLAAVTNATTYSDTTVQAGTKYGYQVQAVNGAGTTSAMSPAVSVTMPASDKTAAQQPGPPPVPVPPMPTGWPAASNTGASGALADVSGDVTLGDAGAVYTNKRVHGTLTVTACNVTIRNVEVDTGEPFTGNSTPDLFGIWLQESATCGVTLDHVSTITLGAPNVYVTTSVRVARGGPVTITNSKMLGAQLGILGVSTGAVRGNYIELGQNMRGDHNDAIQGDGASNLTIDHNTLLNPNDQTSALALYTEFGNNNNITVTGNLFAGGGYACYCGDGASDNNGNPARAVNVSFVNNVFWRKYFPSVGSFGPGRAFNPAGGGRWVNNVYMNADGTVTADQVPQPGLDGS